MKFLVAAAAAALTLSAAPAAFADPLADTQMTVKTDDLDLASAAGQTRLGKRVARAAEEVCGKDMDRIHLGLAAKARDCRIATIEDWQTRNRAALETTSPAG